MTDQELFDYTQERGRALNESTRANKYQMRYAEEQDAVLLRDAIQHFAKDMYNKALLARDKYGFHPMGWACPDWQQEMQRQMAEHVLKGDPRDTGWLSTIAWYHGWPTAAPAPAVSLLQETPAAKSALVNDAERRYLEEVLDCLPNSMSDFLADFLKRLTPAALQYKQEGGGQEFPLESHVGISSPRPEAFHFSDQEIVARLCEIAAETKGVFLSNHAASRVAALLATPVATAEGGGGWISVAERLPEPGQRVLLLYGNGGESYEGYMESGIRVVGDLTGRWWWSGLESIPKHYITYWMPIPTPPADDAR